jgi:hypothetical protein
MRNKLKSSVLAFFREEGDSEGLTLIIIGSTSQVESLCPKTTFQLQVDGYVSEEHHQPSKSYNFL